MMMGNFLFLFFGIQPEKKNPFFLGNICACFVVGFGCLFIDAGSKGIFDFLEGKFFYKTSIKFSNTLSLCSMPHGECKISATFSQTISRWTTTTAQQQKVEEKNKQKFLLSFSPSQKKRKEIPKTVVKIHRENLKWNTKIKLQSLFWGFSFLLVCWWEKRKVEEEIGRVRDGMIYILTPCCLPLINYLDRNSYRWCGISLLFSFMLF